MLKKPALYMSSSFKKSLEAGNIRPRCVLVRHRRKQSDRPRFNMERHQAYLKENKDNYDEKTLRMLHTAGKLFNFPNTFLLPLKERKRKLRGNCVCSVPQSADTNSLDEPLEDLVVRTGRDSHRVDWDYVAPDFNETREDIFANIVYGPKVLNRSDTDNEPSSSSSCT